MREKRSGKHDSQHRRTHSGCEVKAHIDEILVHIVFVVVPIVCGVVFIGAVEFHICCVTVHVADVEVHIDDMIVHFAAMIVHDAAVLAYSRVARSHTSDPGQFDFLGPQWMGGEYLPAFLPGEIQIARITVQSLTMDVVFCGTASSTNRGRVGRATIVLAQQSGAGLRSGAEAKDRVFPVTTFSNFVVVTRIQGGL